MPDFTLEELQKWLWAADRARYVDEPIYVTPEEYAELRQMGDRYATERELRGWPTGAWNEYAGTRVVVDRQKGLERQVAEIRRSPVFEALKEAFSGSKKTEKQ